LSLRHAGGVSDEPRVLPTREGYDRWAATYDTMGNWLLELEQPEVDRALGGVVQLDLLDVGTGTGRHAIRLASRGARVTALDFSQEMLAVARAKPGAERVHWMAHDVNMALPFSDRSFARVLSALVLEHIPPARLVPFFRELGRVTLPEGRIVVTAMHPAMFLKGISANFHDDDGEIRPRSYPATLSDYVMGAIDASLRIVRLSEHSVDEALAARHERAQKLLGWPALLVLVLAPA
jgi:ubiquinone/menaquinone biosynthesis C-methylase UbiE